MFIDPVVGLLMLSAFLIGVIAYPLVEHVRAHLAARRQRRSWVEFAAQLKARTTGRGAE